MPPIRVLSLCYPFVSMLGPMYRRFIHIRPHISISMFYRCLIHLYICECCGNCFREALMGGPPAWSPGRGLGAYRRHSKPPLSQPDATFDVARGCATFDVARRCRICRAAGAITVRLLYHLHITTMLLLYYYYMRASGALWEAISLAICILYYYRILYYSTTRLEYYTISSAICILYYYHTIFPISLAARLRLGDLRIIITIIIIIISSSSSRSSIIAIMMYMHIYIYICMCIYIYIYIHIYIHT